MVSIFKRKKAIETINDPIFEVISSWADNTGEVPLDSGYRNSAIFSAVSLIAGDLASNRIKSDSSKLEKILNDDPNDFTNGHDLKQSLFTNLLLYGNSFCYVDRSSLNNAVIGFEFIPYGNVRIEYDTDDQDPRYYWADSSKRKGRIKNADILHFKLFPVRGVQGVSPLQALHQQRNAMNQADSMRNNYFNMGYSKWHLTLNAGAVDQEAKDSVRNAFESSVTGDNAGRTIVTDQTISVDPLNSNTDTNIVKLITDVQNASKKDIATVYGIPVDWLGIESEHSNAEQAKSFYVEHALSNYMAAITSELEFKLGQHFEYDLSRLLNTNVQAQSNMAMEQYNAGIITINEARKMMNLEPLENGDERKDLVNGN